MDFPNAFSSSWAIWYRGAEECWQVETRAANAISSLISCATLGYHLSAHLSFQMPTAQYLCPDLQNCQPSTVPSDFSLLMAVGAMSYESLHSLQMKSSLEPTHLH